MDDDALTDFMSDATKRMMRRFRRNTLSDVKTTMFVSSFMIRSKAASKMRKAYQSRGIHIPGFLICSITDRCNLRCKGCYASANGILGNNENGELTLVQWKSIFEQGRDLGISFMILAGGEPLLRREVLDEAKAFKSIVFPVFSNGTLITDNLDLFDDNRNLVPIISIDGPEKLTDERRGKGMYRKISECFDSLNGRKLFHGASVTVTSENITDVTSDEFVEYLHESGCGVVFFIEFVPSKETAHLALGDEGRKILSERMSEIRGMFDDMVFMSFPGDEKKFGGCIGAGRGFIHINPYGDAEACPASPHSDTNLKEKTLMDAISSPLFVKIRESNLIALPHEGGCALAEHEEKILTIEDH